MSLSRSRPALAGLRASMSKKATEDQNEMAQSGNYPGVHGADPTGDPVGRALMERARPTAASLATSNPEFSGGVAPDPTMQGFLQALKEKHAVVRPSGGASSPGSNQLIGASPQVGSI